MNQTFWTRRINKNYAVARVTGQHQLKPHVMYFIVYTLFCMCLCTRVRKQIMSCARSYIFNVLYPRTFEACKDLGYNEHNHLDNLKKNKSTKFQLLFYDN